MSRFGARELLSCYARGVFPMADAREDDNLFLIDPERRGVLPLNGFHVSHRIARTIRREPFEIRIDTDFRRVVQLCAEAGPGRLETWINHPIEDLYVELNALGHAHLPTQQLGIDRAVFQQQCVDNGCLSHLAGSAVRVLAHSGQPRTCPDPGWLRKSCQNPPVLPRRH